MLRSNSDFMTLQVGINRLVLCPSGCNGAVPHVTIWIAWCCALPGKEPEKWFGYTWLIIAFNIWLEMSVNVSQNMGIAWEFCKSISTEIAQGDQAWLVNIMMMSSNGNIFPHKGQWHGALMFTLICALNKGLSKQSWGWWFETPSRSLWRHCNDGHVCSGWWRLLVSEKCI